MRPYNTERAVVTEGAGSLSNQKGNPSQGYSYCSTPELNNQPGILGNTTNTVYANRYRLLKSVKTLLSGSNHRVLSCMTALGTYVTVNQTAGHVHFGNVKQCGNIWVCPVCASRVSSQRTKALTGAMVRTNLHPCLVTFTLSHHANDRLATLIDLLNSALKRLKQTRPWKKLISDFGIECFISSLEITYSRAHGFHPHKHLLFFTREPINAPVFEAELISQYTKVISEFGGYSSKYYGVNVQANAENSGSS